jgi:hypothetical protein
MFFMTKLYPERYCEGIRIIADLTGNVIELVLSFYDLKSVMTLKYCGDLIAAVRKLRIKPGAQAPMLGRLSDSPLSGETWQRL